jgi:hypothetical protein
MDLALGSAAGAQDVDLQAAAFEFGIEPALLLDPHADLILDANPAACTCSATTARCCGRPRSARCMPANSPH